MNKNEYLAQLKRRLQKLPQDELNNAIMYYEEYFDDAGMENESEAITHLGTPAEVAGKIIGDFAIREPLDGKLQSAKKSLNSIWITLLAIFSTPITLPLALTFSILICTLVIVLFTLLFSIGITGVGLTLGGILMAIYYIFLLPSKFIIAITSIGMGLISFSIGIVLIISTTALFKKCFKWIAKLAGKFLLRKNKRNNTDNSMQVKDVGGNA